MNTHTEPARTIPVLARTQVLVAGGGPAGVAAAIASARQGARTMLLERFGCFGGVLTQVGVEAIAWYRHKHTVEAGGLLSELEQAALDMGAAWKECQSDSYAIDPQLFRVVCDNLLQQAGAEPLLHCSVVGAIVEDGIIRGVITESKSGRQAILADRVIDCTGDADVAAYSGAPFHKSEREQLMFATQMFHCKHVDTERFMTWVNTELKPTYQDWDGDNWDQQISGDAANMFSPYLERVFQDAIADGSLVPEPDVGFGGTWSTITPEGEVTQLNLVSIRNIDCTDVRDLTRAEIVGRRSCLQALQVLRDRVPGFAHARLQGFGMTVGTRESRLIQGQYTITKRDVFEQGRFPDSIAIFPEFIDGREYLVLPLTGRYYQIPYRALVPQAVDNLLVAGRCISGEPVAHTSFRNMSCCVATGQAAGTAAAVSLREGRSTADLDPQKVRQALTAQNVRVD